MGNVRFGIIGVGNMGSAHLNSFLSGKVTNGTVTAVADTDPAKLAAVQKNNPGTYACCARAEDLLSRDDVDAVIVATPHYLHPDLSVAALDAGKHVIAEKPAGVYTKQVEKINTAAAKSDKLYTVMFNQRTNPLYKKMRALVMDGAVGEIKRIHWQITDWYRSQSYYDSGSWRATWAGEGGGVLFNQCPHQLDLLQWVTGMMPERVRAFCRFGKWHDIEVEDDVTAYMEYGNGATGVFITGTADTPGTNRFEILGTGGKLVCENNTLRVWRLETDERTFNATYKGGFGEPKFTEELLKPEGDNPQHVGILNNFANAILGLEPLYVDGKEGIKSVELMDSMLLSTWLDKAIELPIDGDLYFAELQKRIKTSRQKTGASVVLDTAGTYGGK
ncbi:MAG: Gfo/Idh/MocA family oxidoreductase [Clostridia bacterium]|nr:Gfo/Idh/MocA family oxidoreductase [Clostridia bacterium]